MKNIKHKQNIIIENNGKMETIQMTHSELAKFQGISRENRVSLETTIKLHLMGTK